MTSAPPITTLDARYSSDNATATPWEEARTLLASAEVYWLTTLRPEGRPHVTPLIGIWQDGALHFCTGATERKNLNLVANAHCAITTGGNTMSEGLDIVVEGEAVRIQNNDVLQQLVAAYKSKYGWDFTARDGALHGDGGEALVYAVSPTTAFGFGKGETFSQTRWRFAHQSLRQSQ